MSDKTTVTKPAVAPAATQGAGIPKATTKQATVSLEGVFTFEYEGKFERARIEGAIRDLVQEHVVHNPNLPKFVGSRVVFSKANEQLDE